MTILKTDTVSGIGTEGTVFEGSVTFDSLNYMTLPKGTTTEASFNYAGVPAASARGVQGGGYNGTTYVNTLEYITIATTGNATDFGDLTTILQAAASMSSPTRGVFAGGFSSDEVNTMQYITIATTGNAQDFGDISAKKQAIAGLSNSTRGLLAGSNNSPDANNTNVVEYIQIQTQGNSVKFGELLSGRGAMGGLASETRGIFAGGSTSGPTVDTNAIEYVTIATTSNSTDFGDLTAVTRNCDGASCASSTRGLIASIGNGNTNVIDYITIATTGNAADFGDLTEQRDGATGYSNKIRGVFVDGRKVASPSYTYYNIIDYVTIATTGDATDFGDSTIATSSIFGLSNGHGGLG
tara:strand:- start:968 stop:2026 length:1059 start_codon:yes stop_codon:yes gene_type:complete